MPALHLIAADIADQHGVFTRRRLREVGVTSKRERHAVETGLWVPVLGAAFCAAQQSVGSWQRASAAAALTGGTVSHQTAAILHGLELEASTVHVTVERNQRIARAGVSSHRLTLSIRDECTRGGLPLTTPARTVVDCMSYLPFNEAMEIARETLFRRWIDLPTLRELARRRAGWHGTPQLVRIIAILADGGRSEAERLAHRLLKKAGITGWQANVVLSDRHGVIGEVDLIFAAARLVVEIDGYGVHGRRAAFQRDRSKQNRLIAAGFVVLRFTWEDIQRRPHHVVAQISAALRYESAS